MEFTLKIHRSYWPAMLAVGFQGGRFGLVLGPLSIHAGLSKG